MSRPTKRDIERCRTGQDVSRQLNRTPGAQLLRQNGSHQFWSINGRPVVVPVHASDLGKGIRLAIVKAICAAAGLAILIWVML